MFVYLPDDVTRIIKVDVLTFPAMHTHKESLPQQQPNLSHDCDISTLEDHFLLHNYGT